MNKNAYLLMAAGTCGLSLLLTTGCGKEDTAPPPAATPSSPAASSSQPQSAAGAVATPATPAAADLKKTADKTAADAQKTASAAADDAVKLADSTIASIKKLIGEKKYQEALTSLQQAAKLQLTPEQKKTVDGLLAEVQKLLATDPSKAAGGPVPPLPK